MGGFSELIKGFDKTRDYVRDFFIYGFKVRSDFERKSLRTYDDEKRRVESWLGDNMRCDDSVRGRQVSISVDSGHISENPLYSAYYSKSFTDNDIRLHFMLTDILQGGECLSLRELTERLDESFGVIFEEQTVRNKLKEYAEEGIFIRERRGKTDYFRLSHDTADSFFGEYEGLSDAVKFFSEIPEFGIVGNSILKTAGLKNDLFFMKHNYIVHTLEDVILPDIISAIDEKRYLSFRTFSAKNRLNNGELGEENQTVPLQIFSSVQTGRRYLAAYIPKYKRFNAFRLDFVRTVKAGVVCAEYDNIAEKFRSNVSHCFGVSFGGRKEHGFVEPMRITFVADEKREGYIIDRLNREKRIGTVERTGDGLYTLTADVFDPSEIMHWVKTFIGRIKSVEGGCEAVRKMFYGDVRKMYHIYTEQDDEHIQ